MAAPAIAGLRAAWRTASWASSLIRTFMRMARRLLYGLGMNVTDTDRKRDTAGRYALETRCDCCSKVIARGRDGLEHGTDDEVCGAGDGPGFYLCTRVRCGAKYDGRTIEERRAIFTAGRARNIAAAAAAQA